MIAAKSILVLLAVVGPFCARGVPLTGVWDPCAVTDPKLNECMKKSVEKFIPAVKKGIPQYGIPVLDPALLDVFDLSTKDLKLITKNSKMSKMFTDYQVMFVEADPNNFHVRMNMRVPEITNEGEYEMEGKMLSLPVKGSGHYRVDYKNVSLDFTFDGKAKMKDGKKYMDLESVKVMLMPDGLDFELDNLFNGNKELSDNFHKVMLENWREFWNDAKDALWKTLGNMFTKSFKKMFDSVPYDEIFIF